MPLFFGVKSASVDARVLAKLYRMCCIGSKAGEVSMTYSYEIGKNGTHIPKKRKFSPSKSSPAKNVNLKKKKMKMRGGHGDLCENDRYILLDLGGGTCDVAVHEIIGVPPNSKVRELVPPSGGSFSIPSFFSPRFPPFFVSVKKGACRRHPFFLG